MILGPHVINVVFYICVFGGFSIFGFWSFEMALIVMSMVEGHNLTCLWLLALAYYISGLYGFGPPHVVNGPEAISVPFI